MRSAPLSAFEELQLTREERAPTAAAHTRPKPETQTAALICVDWNILMTTSGLFWAIWQERLGNILFWNVVRSSLPKLPSLRSCFGANRTKITNGSCWIIRLHKHRCSVAYRVQCLITDESSMERAPWWGHGTRSTRLLLLGTPRALAEG